MSREWERALERQLALIEWFDTGSAALWMDMFTRMFRHRMAAEPMRRRIEERLGHADTFYVSEDILKLVEVASTEEAIGNPVLEAHVPFTKSGFAYFQRPLVFPAMVVDDLEAGVTEFEMKVSAVLWSYEADSVIRAEEHSELVDGVSLWLFGSDAQLDEYLSYLEGTPLQALSPEMEFGDQAEAMETLKQYFGVKEYHHVRGMSLIETSSWAQGTEWSELHREEILEEIETGGFGSPEDRARFETSSYVWFTQAFVRRFLFALWSLMAQPIATPRGERPGRAYRRRWEQRVTTAPNYGDVRVVTLRRAVSGGGGEGSEDGFGPEWSHRWVVRGFWRNQWYPSEGVHRLIWIAPYVKGPEDKPLIVKDSVFEVVR